jgi:hypothetical protein
MMPYRVRMMGCPTSFARILKVETPKETQSLRMIAISWKKEDQTILVGLYIVGIGLILVSSERR